MVWPRTHQRSRIDLWDEYPHSGVDPRAGTAQIKVLGFDSRPLTCGTTKGKTRVHRPLLAEIASICDRIGDLNRGELS